MNSALKNTIIAMATAAFGMVSTGCSDDAAAPEAGEATSGAEGAMETAGDTAEKGKDAAEAKCGEGSCG